MCWIVRFSEKRNNVDAQLRFAARKGNVDGVKSCLLDPKCNPSSKDADDETALMQAEVGGSASCVSMILPMSEPLVKNHWGWTALNVSVRNGHVQIARLIDTCAVAQRKHLTRSSSIPTQALKNNDSFRL